LQVEDEFNAHPPLDAPAVFVGVASSLNIESVLIGTASGFSGSGK
jgi:hypothetical protein